MKNEMFMIERKISLISCHNSLICRSGVEEVDEREIFKGSENRLTLKQTYTHEFQCLYRLGNYPFDKQECFISMAITELDNPMMTLFPKKLWM